MAEAILGTGLAITFGTSGFAARLVGIPALPIQREGVEWTPIDIVAPAADTVGNARFLPSARVQAGPMSAVFRLDPSTVPPMHGVIETITIDWPLQQGEITNAQWIFQGFMSNHDIQGAELDTVVDANVELVIDDGIQFVPAT